MRNRGSIPDRGQESYLFPIVQTDSVTHPSFYSLATGGFFLGGKAAGALMPPLIPFSRRG
jgi:hypothetical protein